MQREVTDLTAANRDIVERALFAGLCRDFCQDHARYSIESFSLGRSRGETTAHVTRCCAPDDAQIQFVIDAAPSMASEHRDKFLEMTKVPPGASYELQAWVSMGLWRRKRGDRLTLEATFNLKGEERLTADQSARLAALIEEKATTETTACAMHGRAILGSWFRDDGTETIIDLAVCCPTAHMPQFFAINHLIDKALVSGPVVKISSGKNAPKRSARGRSRPR